MTGATCGLGETTALALGRAGATVVVSGRDAARGEKVVDAIRDGGSDASFVAADVTVEEQAAGWRGCG